MGRRQRYPGFFFCSNCDAADEWGAIEGRIFEARQVDISCLHSIPPKFNIPHTEDGRYKLFGNIQMEGKRSKSWIERKPKKTKESNSEDAKPAASRPSDESQCPPIALRNIPQMCCCQPCSEDEESCRQEEEKSFEADPSTSAHNKKRSHGNLVEDPERETIHETTDNERGSVSDERVGGGKRLHCTPTSTEQEQAIGVQQQQLIEMSHQIAEANEKVEVVSKRLQSATVIITQSVKLSQEKEDENRLLRAENAKLLQRNSELSQELASINVELNAVQLKVLHKDQQIKIKSEQVLYHHK
ncbi:hypothetical protein ACA910_019873 [Epithemia clementina (nom. ined.)]